MSSLRVRAWRQLAAGAALSLLTLGSVLTGCHSSARIAGVAVVRVTLENFKIDAPAVIHAGVVRFVAVGAGPSMHELNVVRTDLARDRLPLAANGTIDDQNKHPDFVRLGEVEGIDIGQQKSLTLRLKAGHYVLYCNMDGHYLAGMSAELTVTP